MASGAGNSAQSWRAALALHGGVFLVYGLFVWLGLALGAGAFNVSPLWPAIGFAIGAVAVFGYRMVLTVALSDLAAASIHAGGFVFIDVPEAVVAGGAAALGAWLLQRAAAAFGRPGADVGTTVRFLVFPCIGAALASAVIGTGVLVALGDLPAGQSPSTLQTWWLGDAVGIVVTTPLVLACLDPGQRRIALQRPREGGLAVAGTLAATLLAFGGDVGTLVPLLEPAATVLPFLVWGALRFGLMGAATCNLLVAMAVTGTAATGLGPYAAGDPEAVLGVQFLLGVVGATILLLGATASRRDHLQRSARRQAAFVQSIAQNLPGAVFRQRLGRDGGIEFPYIAGRLAETVGLRADPGDDTLADTAGPVRSGEPRFEPGDLADLVAALERSARTLEPVEMDLRIRDDAGTLRWGRSISRPSADRHGRPIWDGILLDVTEEKRQRERVEYLARHDPLTGLLNRHGLHEQLGPLLARAARQQQRLGFCLFDLDGFKEINDSYGHSVGDTVLQALGARLRGALREEDLKARLGGDEFLLVQLDAGDRGALEHACHRVLETLSELVECDGHRLQPAVSMGVSVYPDDGDNTDALLAAADQALYAAKTRERGNLVFHGPGLGHVSQRGRLEMGRDLARAIEAATLEAHYQPQIDSASDRVVGVEALARWHHPERGWIPPGEFVPLAEHAGRAAALDRAILKRALAEVGGITGRLEGGIRLSVNLSGASVRDARHRRRVAADLRASGVAGEHVELELTETTLAQAIDEDVGRALQEIAATGIGFAIDDFGTGYGSLTYLRNLPIARIKIDRMFVQGAPHHPRDREIVRALVGLAAGLGIGVVAEGVETREQLEAVRAAGCTVCQGFYFAPALPPAELEGFIARHGVVGA